jgi:hypothetical protein
MSEEPSDKPAVPPTAPTAEQAREEMLKVYPKKTLRKRGKAAPRE